MLNLANDIRSLSEFKRNTVDLLDRLRKTSNARSCHWISIRSAVPSRLRASNPLTRSEY